jgi:hypothetical protein
LQKIDPVRIWPSNWKAYGGIDLGDLVSRTLDGFFLILALGDNCDGLLSNRSTQGLVSVETLRGLDGIDIERNSNGESNADEEPSHVATVDLQKDFHPRVEPIADRLPKSEDLVPHLINIASRGALSGEFA